MISIQHWYCVDRWSATCGPRQSSGSSARVTISVFHH